MPYLSDIQHRRVIEPNGTEVAKLADLAVVPQGQFPAVQWAILATPSGERIVRWNEMAQEIGHLRLRGRLATITDATLPPDALRLSRDLMDKQVVDTHGAKVVRVNDLQLSEVDGQLRLVGADVGLRGLLRRVGAENLAERVVGLAGQKLPRGIIPWHLVETLAGSGANVRVTVPRTKLALLHPADIADIVEEMTVDERRAVFEELDIETAADTLSEVEPEMQASIVSDLDEERAADILDEMAPDEAADLLQDL
ncbi:MAG: magnesium transporter MgtE, partial [Chloroflexota bacterium]|nr:magnesium transporter MgtE [Chloroflexota bacterium]